MREPEGVALVRKGKSNYITAKFAWVVFFVCWLVLVCMPRSLIWTICTLKNLRCSSVPTALRTPCATVLQHQIHILLHPLGPLQCCSLEVMALGKGVNLIHLHLILYEKESGNGLCVYIWETQYIILYMESPYSCLCKSGIIIFKLGAIEMTIKSWEFPIFRIFYAAV